MTRVADEGPHRAVALQPLPVVIVEVQLILHEAAPETSRQRRPLLRVHVSSREFRAHRLANHILNMLTELQASLQTIAFGTVRTLRVGGSADPLMLSAHIPRKKAEEHDTEHGPSHGDGSEKKEVSKRRSSPSTYVPIERQECWKRMRVMGNRNVIFGSSSF